MQRNSFTTEADPVASRAATGLAKVGLALRNHAWEAGYRQGLTPTQGQILALLKGRGAEDLQVSEVAELLAITPATASDSVAALVEKGLVKKLRGAADGRVVRLRLTPAGVRKASSSKHWTDFLQQAIDSLDDQEQEVLLRLLVKLIRRLQERGRIPVARMCTECQFFEPYVHADPERPHHCRFVDAAFGDRHLRLDCPDQQPADEKQALAIRERFFLRGEGPA